MGSNFSWQTEDDDSWHELPTQPRPHPPRRRVWLWVVLLLAAAILTPLIIYNRLQKQVETATAQARDDVIAAHTLSQHAAANQDTDLFRSNLSRHDPTWADVQRELVSRGLYLDRSAFGLVWWAESALNQANPMQPISLTLSPDLLTAHITYEQEYRLTDPLSPETPSNQTIRLQHTDVYRRGQDRWLRADPLDDFWGALEEVEHTYLTVQYNARDAAIATRLAEDLNGQLTTVCQTFPAVNCDDLHLTLLLSRNPDYFFTLLDLEEILTTEDILRLPAPTLVGVPLEDVGYQFLLRGYAVPLVSLAITRLTGYECCHHSVFFRAFLDKELSRLNLTPWPLTAESYAQLSVADLPGLVITEWDRESIMYDEATRFYLYSLVDFLTEATRPQLDITYWQSSLRPGMSYWSWIEPRLVTATSTGLFNTRWLNYIEQQRQAIPPPPIRLPEGELRLSCMDGTIHYQPASNSWSESNQTSAIIRTIPGGYLAQAVAYQGDARSLLMVQNNHTTVITSTNQAEIVYGPSFFTQPYPWLHFTTINLTAPDTRPQDWLVNLDSCKEGECDLRPLRGTPIFSPDGQNMLVLVDGLGTGSLDDIYLTTPTAPTMRQVGRGYGWFWLDNEHFAFFYDFTNRIEMYIGQTDGSTPRHVFTNSDLSRFFPEAQADSPYHINWISPRPQAPHETLLWMTYTGSSSYELVFHLTWDDTWQTIVDTKLVWEGDWAVPSFSPDGRFYLFDQPTQLPNRALILRDVASGAEQLYEWSEIGIMSVSTPFWLDDGRWLVYISDTELTLIAPHENYARRIPHAFFNCNYAIHLPAPEPPDMRGR